MSISEQFKGLPMEDLIGAPLIAAANVIESNFQTALMAPTEILAKQHYHLAVSIFKKTNGNEKKSIS